jgi:hypothetical protein
LLEIEMRKSLIIAFGLALLCPLASMRPTLATNYNVPKACMADYRNCLHDVSDESFCVDYLTSCNEFNRERGFRDPSDSSSNDNGDRPKKKDGDQGGGSAKGGGSRPKPGAHRTADGGTIMVTPEGKEWVWNGKTTTVVLYSRSNSAVYITVMQGDPDVSLRKVVNGRSYNVADPAYAAAIAAEQAKAGGSKGGAKGGPKVGYHPPASLAAGGGVATFNAPAQPTPVAGAGAVGTGAGTNASAQKTLAPKRQNAVGNVLGGTGILGTDRPKLHAN